jgi:hypothetical protein
MIKDKLGKVFHVGCKAVRAVESGYLEVVEITKIDNGKIYINGSRIPIKYPARLVIIEQDPLVNYLTNHKNNDRIS